MNTPYEPFEPPSGAMERQSERGREPPASGHVLDEKYRIDGVLGRGGMSVVMAGHQLGLDRPVAVKFLRGALAERPRPSRRFSREAMAIAKMQSEHVVRVIDAGEDDGLPYIVMERLVGSDLAKVLAERRLPVEDTITVVREAAEAIAEAHALGIVHRDVKPSNLFLATVGGRRIVKVLDFGVSKWLGAAPDADTPFGTGRGGIVGTPAYASPEQLKTPEAVDARTDVWALGVVLYQCLCGRLPFEADSVPTLCAAILEGAPAPFESEPGVPQALQEIVRRCLRRDPNERFQSVRELDRALADYQAGGPLTNAGTRASRRRRWTLAMGAAASLLMLVVLAWSTRRAPADASVPAATPAPNSRVEAEGATPKPSTGLARGTPPERAAARPEPTVVVRREASAAPVELAPPRVLSKPRSPVNGVAAAPTPAAPSTAASAAPPASAEAPAPRSAPVEPTVLYRR